MIKVKCIKDNRSTQLFVGETYRCIRYYESGKIYIKGLSGHFKKSQFALMDGKPIPDGDSVFNIDDTYYSQYLRREDLEENLPVICMNERLKTLTYKKIYHIDKIDGYRISVKENSDGRVYSTWNFHKIPTDRLRELELENLLDEGDDIKKLTSDYDKYNHIKEYEKVQIMLNAILDAIYYKDRTDTSISLFDIMKKRKLKSSLYTIEDFKSLSDINWEEFLT